MLWAHDTGNFPDETWAYLCEVKPALQLISLDCTSGSRDPDYPHGHMGLPTCEAVRERLRQAGLVGGGTICVLNHFSHNGRDVLYANFKKIAAAHGFLASCDGMSVNF